MLGKQALVTTALASLDTADESSSVSELSVNSANVPTSYAYCDLRAHIAMLYSSIYKRW
jgi:hypothetical protein